MPLRPRRNQMVRLDINPQRHETSLLTSLVLGLDRSDLSK